MATSTHPASQRADRPSSRRFWWTVAAFAVANAAIWVGYHRLQIWHRPGILSVERFSPTADESAGPRAELTWAFNLDIAPPASGEPVASIQPAIPGRWTWPNARTLRFSPDADFLRATRFTVTLASDRLHSVDGFRLAKPFTATFQTAPVSLKSARQTGIDGERAILELQFDDAVVPAEVFQRLSLVGPNGKSLSFEPHGLAEGAIVRVMTAALPPARNAGETRAVRLTLAPGLAGRAGPLATAAPITSSVVVDSQLVATAARAESAGEGESNIRLQFNGAVDFASLGQILSVEPAVPFTVSSSYDGVELNGDFSPGLRYAIKLAAPPAGMKKETLPKPTTLSVFVPDRRPEVWFEHASGYLGSRGNRTVTAHAINTFDLRVKITRLYDSNLVDWRNATSRGRYGDNTDAYSTPIAEQLFHLPRKKNEKQELRVSLDELLPKDAPRDGAYRVQVSPVAAQETSADEDDEYDIRPARRGGSGAGASTVVTLSDLAITARTGKEQAVAWVTSLSTAKPQAGVRVRAFSNKNQPLGEAVTDDDGLARIDLGVSREGESAAVLIADRTENTGAISALTWLDLSDAKLNRAETEVGGRAYLRTGYEAFAYADRGVYRPGETVHLRTIVRGADNATPTPFPVAFAIVRPDLRTWRTQTVPLDRDGAAGFDLPLPADLPTGRWTVKIELPGGASRASSLGSVTFQIEEFIPDRMKVALAIAGAAGPDVAARVTGGTTPIRVETQADYLFGRPVEARPAKLVARIDPAEFKPAGWAGWTFGDAADTAGPLGIAKPLGRRLELAAADLNRAGHASWDVNIDDLLSRGESVEADKPPANPTSAAPAEQAYAGPWTLTTTASVTEEGGRAVSATRKVEVDLVNRYLGARRPSQLVRPKTPASFDVAFVSPTGKSDPAEATVSATLYHETWNNSYVKEGQNYRYISTRVLEKIDSPDAAKLSMTGGRGTCGVIAPTAGAYVLRLTDEENGAVASVTFFAGQNAWDDQVSRDEPEKLEVVILPPGGPDAVREALTRRDFSGAGRLLLASMKQSGIADRSYAIGEKARVLVRSPFKGRLLLTAETDSVVWSRVVEMDGSQVTIPIEVSEAFRPNAYVTATVIRQVEPNAAWRVHRAAGVARLTVNAADRRLNVQIAAPAEIRPLTTLSSAIRVTDSAGKPVADAAVTLAAVDEGICRLTDFKTPDPFKFFSGIRALAVEAADAYGQLMPEVARAGTASTPGGDADGGDRYRSPVGAKRVKPVALFSGVVRTDAAGIAHVDLPVPQFTGEVRLMAIAYRSDTKPGFGSADRPAVVRSPLLVQSSWPRFAAPGDRFTVPFVVFNNSPASGEVAVKLEVIDDASNTPTLRFAVGDAKTIARTLRVTSAGQVADAVEVIALERPGVTRVRLTATMGNETFEETVELPVRPAAPTVTRGGFASSTPGNVTTVSLPSDLLGGTGDARIDVSPWPTLDLPEGLDYLERYPYGCAEQTVSGLFPLAYLSDIGATIAPHVFDRERVAEKMTAGINHLLALRTADGGIGMWPAERQAWPWASVYAAHFVVEAKAAGQPIPDDLYDGLLNYARALLAKPGDSSDAIEAQAYACYVLALSGKPERAAMSRLAEVLRSERARAGENASGVPAHAAFHLASAWLAAGRKDLAEQLIPKTLPKPRATRQLAGNVGSPIRDRALMLSTLLAVQPDRADLPALAQELADAGHAGKWQSTQDTAFAVMALGRYLRQFGKPVPYDAAEIWAGGKQVASATAGQSVSWKLPAGVQPEAVEIRVAGPVEAKAHVTWLQTGVPMKPPADAASGITVARRYLDDHGKPLKNNSIRSGDLVRVELTVGSATSLGNIVVEDLLPAGLEIENPRLATQAPAATAAPLPRAKTEEFEPRRVDMRDDRMILMGDLPQPGSSVYVYTARAVAPGVFVAPPVQAECMYDLGTSATSGGGTTLRVEPMSARGIASVDETN